MTTDFRPRVVTAAFCALILLTCGPGLVAGQSVLEGPRDPLEIEAFFDALIPVQLAQGRGVGATLAVVRDGAVLFSKGYGYADLDGNVPVIADQTLFYPGSAGKIFTWTAVMQLVEQGRIDLDSDVQEYLDFQIPRRFPEPMTVAHLMTHSAGFEEQLEALLTTPEAYRPLRTMLIDTMPSQVYPPGRSFAYSNWGTGLAGYVVQRVSGEPYEQYVTTHILEPLGMSRSAAAQPLPEPLAQAMSRGYTPLQTGYDSVDLEWISALPAAPVRATATDMARFMIAHLQEGRYGDTQILQPETVQRMHRQQLVADPRLTGFTFGFMQSNENGQQLIWHDGESARFSTRLTLLPEHGVGIFVSFNTAGLAPRATVSAFLDRYYPQRPDPGQAPTARDLGGRVEVDGTYVPLRSAHTSPQKLITWLGAVEIHREADIVMFAGERYRELEPGIFHEVGGERRIAFATNELGHVTSLFWGPIGYFRVPWYQSLSVQIPIALASLAVLISGPVSWLVIGLARWGRGQSPSGVLDLLGRLTVSTLVVLVLATAWWSSTLLLRFAQTYAFPGRELEGITWLLWLVPVLAATLTGLAVWSWRRRYWGLFERVHFSLIALAAIVLSLWLAHWNLLGGLG